MDNKFTGSQAFNPMNAQLPEEARKALVAAFDAMTAWRSDMVAASEKGGEKAFEKMAAAAKALGWPAQIVDTAREQLMGVSRMQTQMIDKMMDAWVEQVKSPNPMGGFPQAMVSKLQSVPGMQGMPGMPPMPGMEAFSGAMTNPLQFWMSMGDQWQKNWAQAMQMWASSGQSGPGGTKRNW